MSNSEDVKIHNKNEEEKKKNDASISKQVSYYCFYSWVYSHTTLETYIANGVDRFI